MTSTDAHLTRGQNLADCIEACRECHETCEQMLFQRSSAPGGRQGEAAHFRLLADCAQICWTAADFMIRDSVHSSAVCRVCAEICDACADHCERVGSMDECSSACRRCGAACREMSG